MAEVTEGKNNEAEEEGKEVKPEEKPVYHKPVADDDE